MPLAQPAEAAGTVVANLREAECTRRDREAAFRPAPEQGLDGITTRLWVRQAGNR
jgi:hypothetical protein